MPAITKRYNISPDPDMHAIGGASSGAIAAFSVAWERPDQFRKVISIVGSFVNLRGGQVYPERILATDKKPIRIFLQDGVNDNRALKGDKYDPDRDWHYQNVRLQEALTKKGYDVNYTWGIGLHGQKQGGAILPEMMRWLCATIRDRMMCATWLSGRCGCRQASRLGHRRAIRTCPHRISASSSSAFFPLPGVLAPRKPRGFGIAGAGAERQVYVVVGAENAVDDAMNPIRPFVFDGEMARVAWIGLAGEDTSWEGQSRSRELKAGPIRTSREPFHVVGEKIVVRM